MARWLLPLGSADLATGGAIAPTPHVNGCLNAPMRPLKPPASATIDDFDRLDIRVGRITSAEPLAGARRPAYRLAVDFGPAGSRTSSAQLVATYPDPATLVGRLVIAVVNFPPRRGPAPGSRNPRSGALPDDGRIPLLGVDTGAQPGDPVG